MAMTTYHAAGTLTDIEIGERSLTIRLTDAGREYLRTEREALSASDDLALLELLAEHLERGDIAEVRPEEAGALTASLLLGYGVKRDDHGDLTGVQRLYYYDRYALDLYTERLMEAGELVFDEAR
jgi:hypothetical protein